MKACGLIVEYNPFHNGHVHHIQNARKLSGATCIIAVMSGSFLQRGEPAIIDKFHRAKAALQAGIDLVIELPYLYSVQHSDIFAKGTVRSLHELGVSSICFGSESGSISDFTANYANLKEKEQEYNEILKFYLDQGLSYPEASGKSQQHIGIRSIDDTKPNNMLGFSYLKEIYNHNLPIQPLTIQRIKNDYHDPSITKDIASATSIRKQLFEKKRITEEIADVIPPTSNEQLRCYKQKSGTWHEWEAYFPLLAYRVMSMSASELANTLGVEEGIEHRIKKTVKKAKSFSHWMNLIKTKRYTWTRIQRIFTHILTNTKKTDAIEINRELSVPYIRLLGFNQNGQAYLNKMKQNLQVPLLSSFKKNMHPVMETEEKVSLVYYSIMEPSIREQLMTQELQAPLRLE